MADPANPPKTIGDEINLFETKVTTADQAAAAAAAADKAMSDSATDRDGEKVVLTDALVKTGPITKSNPDGSFSTYRTVVTGGTPTLLEETSKGVDTPLDDTPAPTPTPEPEPGPTPEPSPEPVPSIPNP